MMTTLFIPVDVVLPPLFFAVADLRLRDSPWRLALPFVDGAAIGAPCEAT